MQSLPKLQFEENQKKRNPSFLTAIPFEEMHSPSSQLKRSPEQSKQPRYGTPTCALDAPGNQTTRVRMQGGDITSRQRIVHFNEQNGSQIIKRILDFNSPITAKAAAQLGITFEECQIR